MATAIAKQDAQTGTAVEQVDEFSALLKQSFKSKTERAASEVDNAITTLVKTAMADTGVIQEDVMDTISYRALSIGWPLFTLGMITGSIWSESAWGSYWSWQPKETASLLVWVLYLAVLHLRTIGWRGKKMAWLSIAGFLFVLVSFFVVSRIGVGKHTF